MGMNFGHLIAELKQTREAVGTADDVRQKRLDAGTNQFVLPPQLSSRVLSRLVDRPCRADGPDIGRKLEIPDRQCANAGCRVGLRGAMLRFIWSTKHERDVKPASERADRLEWEAGVAIDYTISSVEQAKLAVLDAIDGRLACVDLGDSSRQRGEQVVVGADDVAQAFDFYFKLP